MESIDKEHTSFRNFSEQLRLETATAFSSLSIGDSIWGDTVLQAAGKAPDDCRNFPSDVAPERNPGGGRTIGLGAQKLAFTHPSFYRIKNKEEYSSSVGDFSHKSFEFNKGNGMLKNNCLFKTNGKPGGGKKNSGSDVISGKTNGSRSNGVNKSDKNTNGSGGAVDKRIKVLPPSEALPRSEAVGGYIFVCSNDTMQENLNRQLFGLPPRFRDSVRAIIPGLPLFLYNYSTHLLFGIFQAASFGGTNIDPLAWEDKKNPGESRFPAQVRIVTKKLCDPLEENSFRPFLHHYDGPKFRLELSVPEALALLDIFAEQNV